MSDSNLARRAKIQVAFDGVDITSSIAPYILSATYTDNEEDETDDLQIELQDRDGIWLTKWLGAAIDAAASTAAPSVSSSESAYKVNAQSGLNVRSGPGTNYSKLGALAYGETITVTGTSGQWSIVDYNGKTAYVYSSYLIPAGDAAMGEERAIAATGMKISAIILRQNWRGDGKDDVLDCGQFELDSVTVATPPSTVIIKGTSLPYSSQIRQTKKSKGWEAYYLSGIAKEMALKNGMVCMFESTVDPFYSRVEQYKVSDIDFLSELCHNAGISLKATNNIIVLFDQADYEAKSSVLTIKRGDGTYMSSRLSTGSADTQYSSCRVSYVGSDGKCVSAKAYIDGYEADSGSNQQLEITAKVSTVSEAENLAAKQLRLHNKYARVATFTMPGNPALLAGVAITLEGWGVWSGKYIISQAKHSVSQRGYTTQIKSRKALEGY